MNHLEKMRLLEVAEKVAVDSQTKSIFLDTIEELVTLADRTEEAEKSEKLSDECLEEMTDKKNDLQEEVESLRERIKSLEEECDATHDEVDELEQKIACMNKPLAKNTEAVYAQ